MRVKRALRRLLEATPIGYRLVLRRDCGIRGRLRRPEAPWHNAVLQTGAERDRVIAQVKALGLPVGVDPPKCWDCLAALDAILRHASRRARVLDAGAERYSQLLPWLCLYGFRRLEGINLVFGEPERRGPITYRHGDVTRTPYAAGTFDAISCLSVVEHGVPLDAYFREMARILKPGGLLVTSTDYWPTPIDTRSREAYGVPVHIFSEPEIRGALDLARSAGLVPTGPLDLTAREKVIHWQAFDLDYTFLVFTLRKA